MLQRSRVWGYWWWLIQDVSFNKNGNISLICEHLYRHERTHTVPKCIFWTFIWVNWFDKKIYPFWKEIWTSEKKSVVILPNEFTISWHKNMLRKRYKSIYQGRFSRASLLVSHRPWFCLNPRSSEWGPQSRRWCTLSWNLPGWTGLSIGNMCHLRSPRTWNSWLRILLYIPESEGARDGLFKLTDFDSNSEHDSNPIPIVRS